MKRHLGDLNLLLFRFEGDPARLAPAEAAFRDGAAVGSLDRDPEIHGQFEVWNRERSNFNRRLSSGDPDTVRESWQRFYFKGEIPEEGPAPVDHVNKRRLKPIKFSL